MRKFRDVVFIDDSTEFDKWYVEYDEFPEAGFRYLMQWEYGQNAEERDSEPWGSSDTVVYFCDGDLWYAVSYNWNLSYVALTEVIDGS